jgi:hypothetical protein
MIRQSCKMPVIPMSIAPFGSDEHLLKFAKWFFRNRLETFRKDIDICMTPNSRGQHAYFPALFICIAFTDHGDLENIQGPTEASRHLDHQR